MAKHLNAVAFMKKTGIIMIAETSTMPLTYKSKSEVVKLFDVDEFVRRKRNVANYMHIATISRQRYENICKRAKTQDRKPSFLTILHDSVSQEPSAKPCGLFSCLPLDTTLFQPDDVAPTGGGVLAFEIVLDGIGKNLCLPLAILLRILPASYHNRLTPVQSVDSIHHGIQSLVLLYLFRIDVEQVLLEGRIGRDAHDNDSGFLVLIAWFEDASKYLCGRLDYECGGIRRCDEPCFL